MTEGAPVSRAADSAFDLALLALTGAALVDIESAAMILEHRARDAGDALVVSHVVAIVEAARRRVADDEATRRDRDQLEEAQRIGRMGSYDWDVTTDTNRWSDELYRIYGTEPQSFNATYERFISFVHPDDRAQVEAVHQRAFETKGEYHTVERIVRADGEVRLLDTWGEVVTGADGSVVRLRGICRDITEQYEAQRSAQSWQDRVAAIVDSTPDALLVVGRDGVVRDANNQVAPVLGYERDEIVGQKIEVLLPDRYRGNHEDHRRNFFSDPHPRSMGVGLDLFARRKDGTEIPVDVALGTLTDDEGGAAVAFVRDISERRRVEELAVRLREAEIARRQALEINDNVVQGIVTALLRLELDDLAESVVADGLRRTLEAARGIISDLLGERDVEPGALVRSRPADVRRA